MKDGYRLPSLSKVDAYFALVPCHLDCCIDGLFCSFQQIVVAVLRTVAASLRTLMKVGYEVVPTESGVVLQSFNI